VLAGADLEKIKDLKGRLEEYKNCLDRSLLVDTRELGMSLLDQMARLGMRLSALMIVLILDRDRRTLEQRRAYSKQAQRSRTP
jgi:hypothetical protein